jgi:phosphoglycerate dehydrogenase-like enzyme
MATMPKLLILSDNTNEYTKLIQQADLPDLEIVSDPAECDIVLGEPRKIRDALPLLPRLRWVQSIYAGVEALVDSSQRRDYILTNARGVFGELMSEYVFGYMLAHEKKIFERYRSQQSRKWDRVESGLLRGKTLGLLGVGSIGAHLASTARHFGMKVRGFTRESEDTLQLDNYYHPPDILKFANGLDYLVSVLPRTEGTNKIVNEKLLDALPPHAIFINVGRGNAVDESALMEALNQGKIAGAVLDVTEQEPLPENHPFWTIPNLLLTFHTSAISYPEDITKLFIENYRRYIEGKPLKYQVNFERGY